MNRLQSFDPDIARICKQEQNRIESNINLIASENYTYPEVLEATHSLLTNKYAEGYPGKRYYGGCIFVDEAENLAIERCKKLFNTEHANVQPHSGSQANMAVYFALLNPGDTILGMNLSSGGHLTHGYPINFSGTFYQIAGYNVNRATEQLDYNEIEDQAKKHKPKLIVCGASAYSRTIDFKAFSDIAKRHNAYLMADIAHIAGLVATKLHPSPFPYADVVTTTTHKTLRGPRGGVIMCSQEISKKIDKAVMPGIQGGPLMHHIAAKAVTFKKALEPAFTQYQKQTLANAHVLCHTLLQYGYRIIAGGTDNHLMLVDLENKNITGKEAEEALESVGIYTNRNCKPFDPRSPLITSALRIGTPAITSRGFEKKQTEQVAHLINETLKNKKNKNKLYAIKKEVEKLCAQYPAYEKNITDWNPLPAQKLVTR